MIKRNVSNPQVGVEPTLTSRWILLITAFVWAILAIFVQVDYHINEPLGIKSITTNGHTYFGNPPALTLFQRDPVSLYIIAIVLGVGIFVSAIDLIARTHQRSTRAGVVAIGAGVFICLFSLFGLQVGVASIGVAGALVILSGLPRRSKIQNLP
jgi:hypothetical protein